MKKLFYLLGLTLFLSGYALAANQRIAVIDVLSILQNMPEREQVAKTLEKEFDSRIKTLQNDEKKAIEAEQRLQREGLTLSSSQKKKLIETKSKFEEKASTLSKDYRKRESEEVNKLLAKIRDAVVTIVKKENYSIVLKAEAAFYADGASDITDKVLAQVKK